MGEVTKALLLDDTGKKMAEKISKVANVLSKSNGKIYGFIINPSESDPANAVTYIEDAVGMTPASMNYTTGLFEPGSWEDLLEEWLMPRPCMLKYDGTVDYYLDPNNYAKKEDGVTNSDVANDSYAGNAMMEWGKNGKKIYYKIVPFYNGNGAAVYIADHRPDYEYRDYSFINNQGEPVDHFYTPIYNGSLVSGKLRSISGKAPLNSATAQQEIDYAKANNTGTKVLWYTEVYSDILLINMLLVLLGKSLDTQTVFGNGHYTGGSSASNLLATGTMNDKGLFYGTNGTGVGVKVFGMENWWGNQWRRYAGHINANGTQKVKYTWDNTDGSSANGYNLDGANYLTVPGATPSGTSGNAVNKAVFTDHGMFTSVASGSTSTFYCDGLWFNNSQVDYAYRGGACDNGFLCGAFCVSLYNLASYAGWHIGAAISCKPTYKDE